MTAAIDITKEQRKTLLALLRRFIPGVAVWAYGSRVKWTARPNSDLDLVAFTTPAQSPLVSELKEALAESDLPFLVDFHVWDEVPERFHEIIRKEYVVLQEEKQPENGSGMASDWKTMPLENCMAAIIDYRGKSPAKTTFGVPLVTAKIVKGGRIEQPEEFIAEADYIEWMRRGMPVPGDIVMTTEAPLGEVAQLDGRKVALAQRVITLRGKADVLDNTFLKFLLQSNPVQEELRSRGTGTTVIGIRQSELRKVSLTLPPFPEQKAIAHILGTLDDKIELNRRMNATLETMARALFQSWFVDFDPVRAKLDTPSPASGSGDWGEGTLGITPEIAALFPAHFQDSLLGHIPQGWEVCPLADKIELFSGGTPKTGEPDYWGGDIPWFSVKDAPTETDVWVIHTEKSVTELGISKSASQILPEKTTIITARGTVGKLALTGAPMAMNQSCYGVRGITGYGDFFTYYSLRAATAQLKQHTHGTVFDTITRQTFETLHCIFPPPKLTVAFDHIVEPMLEQIRANLQQSRTLAAMRDALLPKLLSGEMRVLERIAEATT